MEHQLTDEQQARFWEDGFLFPVDAFEAAEAAELRRQLEAFERTIADLPAPTPDGDGLEGRPLGNPTNVHLLHRWAWDAATDQRIIGPITSLLGPNVLLWSLNWFIKEPTEATFVSFHQDANYWGLEPHDVITAWVALSDASAATGPMQFVPGSHLGPLHDHDETFAEDNLLTRGQEVGADVDTSTAVLAPLEIGQMSLHHVRLVHGSQPNQSPDRRIGMVLRFCATNVRQTKGPDTAALVAGVDELGHFDLLPPPETDEGPEERARHAEAVRRLTTIVLSD